MNVDMWCYNREYSCHNFVSFFDKLIYSVSVINKQDWLF